MKYTVIKALLFTLAAFFIIVAPFLYLPENELLQVNSGQISPENNIIILDAGHGGEDGGAVGVGGIIEKDINLAITLKTGRFLRLLGYDTVFTRTTDTMTCDDGLNSQRKKKVSDIKNRLSLLENTDCLCFISIHQNIFGGDVKGAQIFYGGNNPDSKLLAEAIQSGIVSMLQPENKRVIKQATDDIYILYHTEKVAILAECGFISNSSEAALLSDEVYQNKMAFSISSSAVKYLTENDTLEQSQDP